MRTRYYLKINNKKIWTSPKKCGSIRDAFKMLSNDLYNILILPHFWTLPDRPNNEPNIFIEKLLYHSKSWQYYLEWRTQDDVSCVEIEKGYYFHADQLSECLRNLNSLVADDSDSSTDSDFDSETESESRSCKGRKRSSNLSNRSMRSNKVTSYDNDSNAEEDIDGKYVRYFIKHYIDFESFMNATEKKKDEDDNHYIEHVKFYRKKSKKEKIKKEKN